MSERDDEQLDRRAFFRLGIRKAAKTVVTEAEERAERSANRWVRPPFAVAELDFLIKCTRCGDCLEACPHDVLFPLSAKLGVQVISTPAMDLINKGCRMCDDWPCVAACGSSALFRDGGTQDLKGNTEPALPKLADTAIDTSICLPYSGPECGACAHSCPVPGALVWDGPKPRIDREICTGCALCREACIVEPKAVLVRSLAGRAAANGSMAGHTDESSDSEP